jgi:hypothetical protein
VKGLKFLLNSLENGEIFNEKEELTENMMIFGIGDSKWLKESSKMILRKLIKEIAQNGYRCKRF